MAFPLIPKAVERLPVQSYLSSALLIPNFKDIILLFREGCEHGLEFIRMVEEQFPNARFEKEVSQEGEFIISKKIDIPVPYTVSLQSTSLFYTQD